MLHDQLNVLGGYTLFRQGRAVVGLGGFGVLLRCCLLLCGKESGLGLLLCLSVLGGFSLLQSLRGIVDVELSKDCVGFAVFGDENLWVVDHENHSVAFLERHSRDSIELLHAELEQSFAGF